MVPGLAVRVARSRGASLIAALIGAVVAAIVGIRSRGGSVADVAEPRVGSIVAAARRSEQCLPFWAALMAHPKWKVQVARGITECSSTEHVFQTMAFDSDGGVDWSAPEMSARHTVLDPEEISQLRALDGERCEQRMSGGVYGWFRLTGDVAPGADVTVSGDSALGGRLDTLFDHVVQRYRIQRLAALAPIGMWVLAASFDESAPYLVRLDETHLTITHGGGLVIAKEIGRETLVDLVDWAIAHPSLPGDPQGARGALSTRATVLAVSLPLEQRGSFEPIEELSSALQEARRIEQARERTLHVTAGPARTSIAPMARWFWSATPSRAKLARSARVDGSVIAIEMQHLTPQLRACFERVQVVAQDVNLTFEVRPEAGRVAMRSFSWRGRGGPTVAECVRDVVSQHPFPPPSYLLQVEYPIRFERHP